MDLALLYICMISIKRINLTSPNDVVDYIRNIHSRVSTSSPFTSFLWQESWLFSLDELPHLYAFIRDEEVIGYCWLNKNNASTLPFVQTWFLNQMGDSKKDQVWIENNNIVCAQADQIDCLYALLQFLDGTGTDKLYVSMASVREWQKLQPYTGHNYLSTPINGYRTFLADDAIEKVLSKNTRAQVRRSIKRLSEAYGTLNIEEATKEQACDYFESLGKYHIQKWGSSPEGSGFKNPYFIAHHTHLITKFFENVSLVRVLAGNTVVGYSYNLVLENNVYFYCSGINYDFDDKKIKPGYTMHFLLMQFYKEKGFEWYDFLGGESQYKQSLSSETYEFNNMTFYPNTLLGKLTYQIDNFKRSLFSIS